MHTTDELGIRRRPRRSSPLTRLRIGQAAAAGGAAVEFPGIALPEPEGRGRRLTAGALAALLHGGALAVLVVLGMLAPEIEEEEIIPVKLLHEIPMVEKSAPAPAPRALAERSSPIFNPAAQAVAPQVINPKVVARAAPSVAAERIQMDGVVTSSAQPRQISRSAVAVDTVKAVTSVAGVQPTQVDFSDAAAPALRGPVVANVPTGPSAGPRQIATTGGTVGTGPAVIADAGSSVREGVLSNRDVLGSPDGPRLASVNTRVGTGNLRGPGGTGTSLGGLAPDCESRPEVQSYMRQIRDRTIQRWTIPPEVGGAQVRLRFKLDVGGSASRVELLSASDSRAGASAVDAMRSASPFPPMNDRQRCLANAPITGTFRNVIEKG